MTGKIRLRTILKELNISLKRVVDFLQSKEIELESNPNAKIKQEVYQLLVREFQSDKKARDASEKISLQKKIEKEQIREEILQKGKANEPSEQMLTQDIPKRIEPPHGPRTIGKIDLDSLGPRKKEYSSISGKNELRSSLVPQIKKEPSVPIQAQERSSKEEIESKKEREPSTQINSSLPLITENQVKVPDLMVPSDHIKTHYQKLEGPAFTGDKIDLSQFERRKPPVTDSNKKKRRRINKEITAEDVKTIGAQRPLRTAEKSKNSSSAQRSTALKAGQRKARRDNQQAELTDEQIGKQIKETLEKLTSKGGKSKTSKFRREKRQFRKDQQAFESDLQDQESKVLKVAEFATVNELAAMMEVPATQLITTCMSLGVMVTLNQRLDAEVLTLVADEFGYSMDFVGADIDESIQEEEDPKESLCARAPIVTVMGHVDHGKTSLLDYIRKTNVIAGESGGITQHIGAYSVEFKAGQRITFLDTPGHEAFTAMRARGTQITDIVIVVIAVDDEVMPQTKEAISHAQAAGVPIIFALNKIDKPTAQPDKIREQLANMNFLVEEWGGKYQSQEISAKTGIGLEQLLEKVWLEAEVLGLKANPGKPASGTVIEATLDKGRGYVTTILVQAGTLRLGDYILAGSHHGKAKALLDERGHSIQEAGPSKPVAILGLGSAPAAGDKFKVFIEEKEAKQIASRRQQLQREQNIRTQKHLTLDEIGRRIALGDFKELKIILKGDVDGSVEALIDALERLSTQEVAVSVIHKGVGQITESDVLLASASDAIIIGFNVRPALNARTIAEKEDIEIRTYSIIYDAINEIKEAIEGMHSPEIREQICGAAEIRNVFKITKIGTIAGCMVTDGKMLRSVKIRLIRDGIVIHDGELASLKRFKEDVKEVSKGYECGLNIKNYNDIQTGDFVEAYEEVSVKRSL
ncbi:translation initiation factor IF-2 [Bacteroidetes bacterium endosymbiont of Geopemphigus sp.]|uniref:translation initiation factor IF-2 n=1 Tax=Bacteroidetes bacterium endosymbiont of Geopemphigus sp. TaxID=2047937 RepID=UPI000CD29D4C|nr:translation initiation factor IF-2 [Bacteroidetes bacterium endosymbiont of Geopemphigus sp.]